MVGHTVPGMAMASGGGSERHHTGSISSVASTRSSVTEDTREDQERPHEAGLGEGASPYLSMQQSSPTGTITADSVQKMHLRARHGQQQKVKQFLKQAEGGLEDEASEDMEEEEYMDEDEDDENEEDEEEELMLHPQQPSTQAHPSQPQGKGKAASTRGARRSATPSVAASATPTTPMRASQGGRGATAGMPTTALLPSSGAYASAGSTAPERHKGSGRKKIDIKPIPYKLKRQITFSKRKTGLLKKVKELTTLTQTDALVILVSETGNPHSYATKRFQDMIRNADVKTLNSFLDLEEKRAKSGKGH